MPPKRQVLSQRLKIGETAQEESAAFGMMNVEINNDRLRLLSIYNFDCRQIKSASLVRIDSRGLPEKTADRSVTVTNSNKLLTGGALSRLNWSVACRSFGRKTICMTTTE